jgi:hypothetical protein
VNKTLTGILGAAQGLFGLLGTAAGGVSHAVGTTTSGNIFNLVSGAVLGALGFGTSEKTQKVGVPIVSALNAIVGVLGIAVLGFIFTFLKTKKA